MYYNTLYGSKANQKEETKSFMNVSNALARRINKKVAEEEQTDPELNMEPTSQKRTTQSPDFVEGLCCLLSGITANLSSTVVSAPLGHALIVKGSRFQFSHNTSPLLLRQIVDSLEGDKEISYYLWQGYNASGKEIQWPEVFATNYLEQPI